LRLESYAKSRSLSNPRFYQDEERAKEYGRRMKEIERLIEGLDNEIKGFEGGLI
jgi:hypothetical protein